MPQHDSTEQNAPELSSNGKSYAYDKRFSYDSEATYCDRENAADNDAACAKDLDATATTDAAHKYVGSSATNSAEARTPPLTKEAINVWSQMPSANEPVAAVEQAQLQAQLVVIGHMCVRVLRVLRLYLTTQ